MFEIRDLKRMVDIFNTENTKKARRTQKNEN